jgi:asparagine synthase (glutamine-hydrolysing)
MPTAPTAAKETNPLPGVATPSVDRGRHLSKDACNPQVRESFAELVEQSLLANGLPLLRRVLDQGSPLIEAGLLDPDGLEAAVTELEDGPYSEDPWSKLVEVITLDQAARAFLP